MQVSIRFTSNNRNCGFLFLHLALFFFLGFQKCSWLPSRLRQLLLAIGIGLHWMRSGHVSYMYWYWINCLLYTPMQKTVYCLKSSSHHILQYLKVVSYGWSTPGWSTPGRQALLSHLNYSLLISRSAMVNDLTLSWGVFFLLCAEFKCDYSKKHAADLGVLFSSMVCQLITEQLAGPVVINLLRQKEVSLINDEM